MANIDNISLAEAVADAKAVINGATVNAKLALEEALTPRIKSILYQKLAEDLEEDTEETMEEELAAEVDYDDSKSVEESEESVEEEVDLESILRELELEEEAEEEVTEDSIDEENEESSDEEIDEEAINEIIASLNDETLEEKVSTIKTSVADYLKFEEKEKDEDKVMDEEIELELDEEEVDLDELMADYEKAKAKQMEEEYTTKISALNKALEEAKKKAMDMEGKLKEMNLLNAKLLYANKLLQEHSLTKEEKHKTLEKLEKAKNVSEVKLVYEMLNENYISSKQNIQESLGFASKTISSTASAASNDNNILNESMADRFKKLANII
jgi:hypothetical protein